MVVAQKTEDENQKRRLTGNEERRHRGDDTGREGEDEISRTAELLPIISYSDTDMNYGP